MAIHAPCPVTAAPDQGHRVELPHRHDAIGTVLRGSYDRDAAVPDDMLMLLRKLSGRPATSRD